jgi:hypothetical protein
MSAAQGKFLTVVAYNKYYLLILKKVVSAGIVNGRGGNMSGLKGKR